MISWSESVSVPWWSIIYLQVFKYKMEAESDLQYFLIWSKALQNLIREIQDPDTKIELASVK